MHKTVKLTAEAGGMSRRLNQTNHPGQGEELQQNIRAMPELHFQC
jgi:hypothetical protein